MKKILSVFLLPLFMLSFLLLPAQSWAAAKVRAFDHLQDGLTGALDKVGCESFTNGDFSFTVTDSGDFYIHWYDSDNTEDENSPDVIYPDDRTANCAGAGAHVLINTFSTKGSAAPVVILKDTDGLDATDREAAKFLSNMSTVTSTAEVSDVALTYKNAGTTTNFLRWIGADHTLILGPQTDGWAGGDVTGLEQLSIDFDSSEGVVGISSVSSSTITITPAVTFSGGLTGTLTGASTSTTGNAATVTVVDAENDTSTWPLISVDATGSESPRTDASLTYNANTGILTATGFAGPITGAVTGNADTATTATNVVITDNENTIEVNAVVFIADADIDGNTSIGLESDGDFTYSPVTGVVNATGFYAGVDDTNAGQLKAYGDTGSSTTGGILDLHTAADHDDSIQYYRMQVFEDDFYFGTNSDSDVIKVVAGTSVEFTTATTITGAATLTGGVTSIGAAANLSGGTVTLGTVAGSVSLSGATSSVPWVVGTATATNTIEGSAYWESDTDMLSIGDGATRSSLDLTANTIYTFPTVTAYLAPNPATRTGDLLYASSIATPAVLSRLADVAVGSYLRSGGVDTAPLWSTLTLPNSGTAYTLPVFTAANTMGELAASGTTGQTLVAVTGAIPAWGTLPVAGGGTGATTLALNGVLYGTGTTAIGATAIGAAGDILIAGADPFVPVWSGGSGSGVPARVGSPVFTTKVTLPTDVTIDNGGVITFTDGAADTITHTNDTGIAVVSGSGTVTVESVVFNAGAMTSVASIGMSGAITLGNGEIITNATADDEVEITSDDQEGIIFDLDTDTDNEVEIKSGTGKGVTQISLGALNFVTTGTITGAIPILADSAAPTAAQCYGSINKSNGVQTVTLPNAIAGMNIMIYSDDATVKTIALNSGDHIWLNGADNGADNTIQSPGAAGDFIVLVAFANDNWYTLGQSGVWIDTP